MKPRYGFEVNIPEGSKIVHIPISEDLQRYFKEELFVGKTYVDYIKEFLITENNYDIINTAFLKAMKESVPECVRAECVYCNGDSKDEADKACQKYYLQMQVTFVLAANEFVSLILAHPHIYNNKKVLLEVTQDFFRSLSFLKDKGIMYFDLENMCKCILNAGFRSLSKIFSKSETLKNLQIINDNIDDIEQRKIQNEIFDKEDEDYLEHQHKFFESKQRYYKEKLLLEEKGLLPEKPKFKKFSLKEKSIPIVALYYYYLQAAGKFPYFENHPEGKIKAIEELIINDNINTTPKYFQIKYNHISNHKLNRIAKNQSTNIDYVANQMLNDYPEAKNIALIELKEALTKNR